MPPQVQRGQREIWLVITPRYNWILSCSRWSGPLARIGPNLLITSDPELLIRMNSCTSRCYLLEVWLELMFSTS